jgi:branched-chain amino acid transport system permease protein
LEILRRKYLQKWTPWIAVLILALAIPPLFGGYLKSILILVCIWIIMGISLNLIFGYTGLLSACHSAFLGIGGYSLALLTVKAGMSFWIAFFASIAIVGLAGFLIALPALRLRGPYFILVTLCFAIIVQVVVIAWINLTGGTNGMIGIPRPPKIPLPFSIEVTFDSLLSMYYFILFFLIVIALINHRVVHSLVGRTFIAISQNEDLAQSLGISTVRVKLLSFVVSAIFAGVAGVLYATYNSVVSPDLAHFLRGFDAFVFLIIGGVASKVGPFIGPLVMIAIPELLQVVVGLKTLIYGVILLMFILFMPYGITGIFKRFNPMLEKLIKKVIKVSHGTA